MKIIKDSIFSLERSLYNIENTELFNVRFEKLGDDGESPLKECSNITLNNCFCDLRYALWHDDKINAVNLTLTENCRAPIWYTKNISINDSNILGVKSFREACNIKLSNSKIVSPEAIWRCKNISINNCDIESEYFAFESHKMNLTNINFKGKYSFQYTEGIEINSSVLNTKDAFWHSKNVVVKNSTINGEYLGWYSDNLTLINCKIFSKQPLCYCKNLKLIDCDMSGSDLAFEYSEVEAKLIGSIESIKNPRSGNIYIPKVKEIINEDDKYKGNGKIIITE